MSKRNRDQRAAKGKKSEKKIVCDLCIGPAMTLVGKDHDTDKEDVWMMVEQKNVCDP